MKIQQSNNSTIHQFTNSPNETHPTQTRTRERLGLSAIDGYLAFYASRVDACYLGDEQVQAQEGDFYGGWITSNIVGPFKGGAGTWGW